mmetsp:Transcript_30771/g.46668  ORF Transcript_30771/g.46668 Transcript_30771/m.46668 type:complete len:275 (+) Transcript_30771:287-1111(+)
MNNEDDNDSSGSDTTSKCDNGEDDDESSSSDSSPSNNDDDKDKTREVSSSEEKNGVEVKISSKLSTAAKGSHSKEIGNGLTEIIPGYTAPLQLSTGTSRLPSLAELRRKAQLSDASTRKFSRQLTSTSKSAKVTGFLPSSYVSSYTQAPKHDAKKSAMKGWFDMESVKMTDEVKADLAVIRNRTYLDPKRFYKKADKFGQHIQIGTVVDSSSGDRYTKKERQQTLLDEVMVNETEAMDYTKRKYRQLTQRRQEATAHHYRKKRKMNNKKLRAGF